MKSVWQEAVRATPACPQLQGSVKVDIAIVGGGITGLTTAWLLASQGRRVAVLEADRFGAGNTGRSTGNLYGTVGQGLHALREKWSAEIVGQVVALRLLGVDLIERIAAELSIECEFKRVPHFIGCEGEGAHVLSKLESEFDAASAAGLHPQWHERGNAPFGMARALRMDRQAQVNPYAYAAGLAARLQAQGARLFEDSRVFDVDASKGLVKTDAGELVADAIVLATHSPVGFNLVQAEMKASTEYGIAAPAPGGRAFEGIHWLRDTGLSLRATRVGGVLHAVAVGEKHTTGEPGEGNHLARLRSEAMRHFGVEEFTHAWSAEQFRSADGLPYIGRSAHDNVFIATGFGADGLTWGTVAAHALSRQIVEGDVADFALLRPARVTPVKSAKGWAEENATVVKHMVGDRLKHVDHTALADIAAGEGRIIEIDGHTLAVHRRDDGSVVALSPVCPHLKCRVAWNGDARTWDCPCHGSRFRADGRLLDGPAHKDLEVIEVRGGG
ncbi:Oxidoreductase [Lysobacter dokdonensis DS-58]|uniref:Oxidoreductase n=1 Tax=Lysobacter dokdonensis DS-58 TaxID=1300345 RepID=A0A0A2X251_9GAMM|nr:FAD-dependent oxidoreductase [Lysobacter dokdonensis]KGQ19304.1 Oxidoreductase [Lysobacter dokdonensis DS-58]